MTLRQSLLLGLLQGVTEFFPISSKGHLVIAEVLLGLPNPEKLVGFDVVLHVGSLLALLACYPKRWWQLLTSPLRRDWVNVRYLSLIVIATVPAVVAGGLFSDFFEAKFHSLTFTAYGLLATAAVLLASELLPRREIRRLCWPCAFVIGLAQVCALFPGVSRSGSTMSAGRAVGLSRKDALDFSFLMAVPIIAGAALLIAVKVLQGTVALPPLPITFAGFSAAFVASGCAILTLRAFVSRHSLAWFSIYLVAVAAFLLF